MKVKIISFPETKVAAIEHRGSPALEHESVEKLIAWRIENNFLSDKHQSYGIHYNNPATTPADEH
jgi:AraC family transcriptional regulator